MAADQGATLALSPACLAVLSITIRNDPALRDSDEHQSLASAATTAALLLTALAIRLVPDLIDRVTWRIKR